MHLTPLPPRDPTPRATTDGPSPPGVQTRSGDAVARLTRREREILGLVARGLSNIAIAELLVVSPRTVDAHIRHIYNALDLADQWEHNRRVLATLDHVAFTTRQQLQEGLALAAAA